MSHSIRIGDKWYVAATHARLEDSPQVLKHDDTFALFDRFGDIQNLGTGEQGLYHEDTRYLSHQELLINGVRPLHLGSSVKEANSLLVIDLMNPDLLPGDGPDAAPVPKGTVHLFRAKLLWAGACYEHLRVFNHGLEPVRVTLTLAFDADFADLFEVRGMQRERRGERLPIQVGAQEALLPYRGRDGRLRRTRVHFTPAPDRLTRHQADFSLALGPGAEAHLYCTVACESGEDEPALPVVDYETVLRATSAARRERRDSGCTVETSNPLVNRWFERSSADLAMLTTALPSGPYPYAGVPWYSTTFGRDGILTAREVLWADPTLARGVLAFLAQTQAREEDPAHDAEPGKILHEARRGEMAATGEIPFGRYYGSVDSTPLFVALAGAYFLRTGDLDLVRRLWPHVVQALAWIDEYGDVDGDGFVEYRRRSEDGLVQQGWKDSHDSVFHRDGSLAAAPIAVVEVQAYVYEAKRLAAELAEAMGDAEFAQRLRADAERLRERFEQAFWSEALGSYALALDGDKRRCEVPASNAGHVLWCGLAGPERAARVIDRLLGEAFHNGWGVRTVAAGTARYNPMSYHNGSVWPHDNALIAAGMARYGRTDAAVRLFHGLFEASLHFDQHRLPELFCGFPRRRGEGPVLYPVACSPQAWAAATAYALLQACLGLEIDARHAEVNLRSPRLPADVEWVRIRRLPVGRHTVDLLLRRYENNVGVDVERKDGDVAVRLFV